MSREFGTCSSGYFHDQIEYAASDCLGGSDQLTKLWGKFFSEFKDTAYAIASSEASDSGPYDSIMENIKAMPRLKERLREIEAFLYDYERVMEEAVRLKTDSSIPKVGGECPELKESK